MGDWLPQQNGQKQDPNSTGGFVGRIAQQGNTMLTNLAQMMQPQPHQVPDFGLKYQDNDPAYYAIPRNSPPELRKAIAGTERRDAEDEKKLIDAGTIKWYKEQLKSPDIVHIEPPKGVITPELQERIDGHVDYANEVMSHMEKLDQAVADKKLTPQQRDEFSKIMQRYLDDMNGKTEKLRQEILKQAKPHVEGLLGKENI